ncbi:MAG: hypothetical protein R8M14_07305 [Ghiorsea sp.]
MGGYSSGRRGWRQKVEAQHSVDIRWMKRKGWLKEGFTGTLTWTCSGEPSGNINFNIENGTLILSYNQRVNGGKWEAINAVIFLNETSCNYGGFRVWMVCPRCQCNCAKIYLIGQKPSCRKCNDLAYYSEAETQLDRTFRKARKVQGKLGYEGCCLDAFVSKPKGMHWKTYNRYCERIDIGRNELNKEFIRLFDLIH